MRILAFSPHADPQVADSLGVRLASLEEVLRESDFLSLHCRLTDATRRMIGAPQLDLMKPTAYFINVGRGELVDQAALASALRDRRIAGAGLDVFAVEPLPLDDPLLAPDNVLLTPHWSASSSDVWKATGKAMAEGMLRAARGERPDDIVNPQVLDQPGFIQKLSRYEQNALIGASTANHHS
jgi:phosphoglycerate dehydrogenase-like enzyme